MQSMQTDIEQLQHHESALKDGGKVVILDPGATLSPEMTAMLQALHSRSVGGINEHLKVLSERGADKFMSSYYVGYGHKSIGDCGTAIVFVEGVSMLAAKALQDYQLYNGQEASTRYIDFANQKFQNPTGTEAGEKILETWRAFYLKAVAETKTALTLRYPIGEGEKETVYQKAIAARAFDITRGFLPAGATTNLAWAGTLRGFADRILQLRHHPLPEVQEIANVLEDAMLAVYPNSFKQKTENEEGELEHKRYPLTEEYTALCMQDYYYHDPDTPELALVHDGIYLHGIEAYRELLEKRPAKTELPKWMGAYGNLSFAFKLDFGSFRDIQRHRAVVQRMPLLTADIGFNDWYLSELTAELRKEALDLLENQKAATANLGIDDAALKQYYLPMGYNISNFLCGDLPALVYLVELRATSLVHPTLAKRAAEMAELLQKQYGDLGLVLHLDEDPGRFNIKRGEQDIVKKEE